ncbi:unnamed protein product [Prunus brigantina]
MSIELHRAATYYVLTNNDDSEPFIQEHKNSLVHSGVQDVDGTHRHQFANWFEKRLWQEKEGVAIHHQPMNRESYLDPLQSNMPLLNHLMIMKYKKLKRHALRLNLQIPKV